jgi:hypothetical protein
MTISLAFLALSLVKAAINGQLSGGLDVPRLYDLPSNWVHQYCMFGFHAPGFLSK